MGANNVEGLEADQNSSNSAGTECTVLTGAVEASIALLPPMPADADLRLVLAAWPALPEPIRVGILAMIKAASQ